MPERFWADACLLLAIACAVAAVIMSAAQSRVRVVRLALVLACGFTLVAVLSRSTLPSTCFTWLAALASVVVAMSLWVSARSVSRRSALVICGLSLSLVNVLALLIPALGQVSTFATGSSLAITLFDAGAAGVLLGGIVAGREHKMLPARSAALALQSVGLLTHVALHHALLGTFWSWDPISCWHLSCWLATAILLFSLQIRRPGGRSTVWAAMTALLLLGQALGTPYVSQWLGYADALIAG